MAVQLQHDMIARFLKAEEASQHAQHRHTLALCVVPHPHVHVTHVHVTHVNVTHVPMNACTNVSPMCYPYITHLCRQYAKLQFGCTLTAPVEFCAGCGLLSIVGDARLSHVICNHKSHLCQE